MRTIEFRGRNIFNDEWLYGNLIKIESNRYSILPEINKMPMSKCIADYEVEYNTVCQFTGLHYKNGKKIFEHDLVECCCVLCEVVYSDKIGSFVLLEVLTQNLGNKPIGQIIDMFGIKQLGNIYDNIELLK